MSEKDAAVVDFLASLEKLEESVDMTHVKTRAYTRHKRAILHSSLARNHLSHRDYTAAVAEAERAVECMATIIVLVPRGDPDFPAFVVEYIEAAVVLARALQAQVQPMESTDSGREIAVLQSALDWAQLARANAQVLYSTYAGEGRVVAQTLTEVYLLETKLLASLGHTKEAAWSLEGVYLAYDAFNANEGMPSNTAMDVKDLEMKLALLK